MSDNLKEGAAVMLGLVFIAGLINHRAEHAIVHDFARSVHGGVLHATVHPRGLLGILAGQSTVTNVTGYGFSYQRIPYAIQSGTGLRAYVHNLDLDFRDITVRGIPVRRFHARIPNVSLDAGRAFFDERIIVRAAGEGIAEAVVDEQALRIILARKLPQLDRVQIALRPGAAEVRAETPVLGAKAIVESTLRLAVSDGRYVSVVDPQLRLNGKPLSPKATQDFLARINPVVDSQIDLGLGDSFYATDVEIGAGTVTVHGRARVPHGVDRSRRAPHRTIEEEGAWEP